MTVPAAPVITALTLSPTEIAAGTEMTALVTWTGYPVQGVSFQWRLGETPIAGATTPTYTPAEVYADLNCLVTIDNGRGTATSATVFATVPEEDGAPSNVMTAGGDPMTAGDDYLTAGD